MKKDKVWLLTELYSIDSTFNNNEFVFGYEKAMDLAIELVCQMDEPEKVIIPQFVADWISQAKKWGISISDSMGHVGYYFDTTQYDKAMYWAEKNQDVFARAWLDGYEIEKGPLYFISFPTQNSGHIIMWRNADTRSCYFAKSSNLMSQDGYKCAFTEKEIKDYDERYWAFAQLVEEGNK